VTGDQIQTNDGIVTIKPIYHASFYLHWARSSGTTIIYSDPSSQGAPAGRFTGLPKADMVLITHRHGDHLNTANLDAIRNGTATKIIASADTYAGLGTNTLGTTLKSMTTIFKTGQAVATDNSAPLNLLGVTIEGVPAYNSNHVKGNCNSYIITIGGKRIYISGDTGAITEMNAMTNIDVAFLCINVPFTMTVAEAAASTRTFKPKIVYPYHLRNSDNTYSDVGLFKTTVGRDLEIEVRNRNWY
jgi:L-ascorbate metabolism protein UlaG (beta-lactamase superfamily)